MKLKELYRTEHDGKTLVAIGNGSHKLASIATCRLAIASFYFFKANEWIGDSGGLSNGNFYALELSDFEKFNAIGEREEKLANLPPIPDGSELQLEVGKTYLNRSGDRVKITGFDINKYYPFYGARYTFKGDGRYRSQLESPLDLISLAPEQPKKTTTLEDMFEGGVCYLINKGGSSVIVTGVINGDVNTLDNTYTLEYLSHAVRYSNSPLTPYADAKEIIV